MEDRYKNWVCPKCGQLVAAKEKPQPMWWDDGHVCYFKEEEKEEK